MSYEVCSRCKRRPADGHDSWCDGSPVVLDTPGPTPVTVRWTEPTYVEPVKAPRPAYQATEDQQAKARTAGLLAAKLAKQAERKAKEEAKAAKEREVAEAKRRNDAELAAQKRPRWSGKQTPPTVPGICDECGGSLAGRRQIARFCSDRCKERAYKKRVGVEVNNARKVAWLRNKVRSEVPKAQRMGQFICSDCGIEKPGVEFGEVRKGRRMKRCRECHSAKVIAGMQRKKQDAAHLVAVEVARMLAEGFYVSPTVRSALVAWLDSDAAQADGELLAIARGAQVG